jgi:drug/metabolite transporter (DMT)-like permease
MDLKIFLKLHLSVFIAGFTGLFGRLVSLNALWITFFRLVFGWAAFRLYMLVSGRSRPCSARNRLRLMACGTLLACHLSLFFLAIKLSNVSIGVLTLSAISFFIAIIEPFASHSRFSFYDICFSLIGMLGLFCIFSFDSKFRLGICVGILCSLMDALYATWNKRLVAAQFADSYNMLKMQFDGALIFMVLVMCVYRLAAGSWDFHFNWLDMFYLFIAGTICTAGLYLLQLQILKGVSAFTMMLTYNLEPVYSIILAMLIFHEANELNFSFYVGVGCIVLSIALKTWKLARARRLDPALRES